VLALALLAHKETLETLVILVALVKQARQATKVTLAILVKQVRLVIQAQLVQKDALEARVILALKAHHLATQLL
jgi:hypothetical protein